MYNRKYRSEGKQINCQSRVYSSIWRLHPSCLQGRKISDIFQSANHRPKSCSEIINIHLSLPSFKLYNKNGLSSSGLNNKLAPSGRRHRAKRRTRVQWRLNNNILWVLRGYSTIFFFHGFQRHKSFLLKQNATYVTAMATEAADISQGINRSECDEKRQLYV